MTTAYFATAAAATAATPNDGPSPSVDLARQDIVYACEISPAVRGWAPVELGFEVTGGWPTAFVPTLERAYTADPFYIATTPFGTGPEEQPASTRFHDRFGSLSFRRSIANGADYSGLALGSGELAVENGDGRYDGRFFQIIAGRDIVIKAGTLDAPYRFWRTIFRGTAADWSFDDEFIRIAIQDDSYLLSVPAQTELFAGTGGAEGGDDVAGKRLPMVIGYAGNCTPVLVSSGDLIYRLHDGALDAVFAVRDRGAVLGFDADYADYAALAAATPAGGTYATCLAEGLIRLESEPQGTVTADAATYRSSGHADLATVIRGVLADRAGIVRFDALSYTLLGALYPGDHGLYVAENEEPSVAEIVDRLMGGVMGYVAFSRAGWCRVGVVGGFDGPAEHIFSFGKAIELSRETLPSGLSPPSWRRRLLYARNHTVQTDNAGSADPIWAQPGKVAAASDSAVKLDLALAQDGPAAESYMQDATETEAEALRQLEILKAPRVARRAPLPRMALVAEIGDLVQLGYDRLGGARRGVNVEDSIEIADGDVDQVELLVYG